MVQKEVAERLTAEPPAMNRLAASIGVWAKPKIIATIPKTEFEPPPEVDSAIIVLETKAAEPDMNRETYYETVRRLFKQPRKTILNNLAAQHVGDKQDLAAKLQKIGVNEALRPQDLSIAEIVRISEVLG